MSGNPHNPCGAEFRAAHGGPFYSRDGKQLAAGERPPWLAAIRDKVHEEHSPPRPGRDPVDPKRPKRPCASCGNTFKPTARRRMLCDRCWRYG